MEINKVDMFKLSDFADGEKVFVSIVNDGDKILIEPLSSIKSPDILEDELLDDLSVGAMMRSFEDVDEMPESFGLILRVR